MNYTSEEELKLIPYIGPTTAQVIIALRDTKGSLHQDTLETLIRTKLDSAVFHVLDFTPNNSLSVRRTSSGYRAEEEGLGSMHASGQFKHSGQMESNQSCLKGPHQTDAAHSWSGVRDKEKSTNVSLVIWKKETGQERSEEPQAHFKHLKPEPHDPYIDDKTRWEMFRQAFPTGN